MHVNYDLVRAVEKITKGLGREEGLGVELLGRYGLDVSGASSPQIPNVGDLQSEDKRNSNMERLMRI